MPQRYRIEGWPATFRGRVFAAMMIALLAFVVVSADNGGPSWPTAAAGLLCAALFIALLELVDRFSFFARLYDDALYVHRHRSGLTIPYPDINDLQLDDGGTIHITYVDETLLRNRLTERRMDMRPQDAQLLFHELQTRVAEAREAPVGGESAVG